MKERASIGARPITFSAHVFYAETLEELRQKITEHVLVLIDGHIRSASGIPCWEPHKTDKTVAEAFGWTNEVEELIVKIPWGWGVDNE